MNYFSPKGTRSIKKVEVKKPPSLFRRIGPFPSPKVAIGLDGIRDGASLIGHLIKTLRQGPRADPRLKLGPDYRIDLINTAAAFGQSPVELQEHMMARREQTRRTAVSSFALAWVFLAMWAFETLFMRWHGSRLLAALEFLPFCGVMFLYAFRSAWLNWQFRTGCLGSAMDYLTTGEPFWPR